MCTALTKQGGVDDPCDTFRVIYDSHIDSHLTQLIRSSCASCKDAEVLARTTIMYEAPQREQKSLISLVLQDI